MVIVHVLDPFGAGLATFLRLLTEELSDDYHIIVHGYSKIRVVYWNCLIIICFCALFWYRDVFLIKNKPCNHYDGYYCYKDILNTSFHHISLLIRSARSSTYLFLGKILILHQGPPSLPDLEKVHLFH